MSFLFQLSDDTMSIVLDYLTSKEFIRIVFMTTKKSNISGSLIRRETIKHLKQTWNISNKDLCRFIRYYNNHGPNPIDFKSYLQYAVPIIETVRLSSSSTGVDNNNNSNNDLILLDNQSVKFDGIVGNGNSSVVSTQPFPAGSSAFLKILTDMEQAMKHRSLQELVNIMKRVKTIILDRSSKSNLHTLADFKPPEFSSPFLYKSRINTSVRSSSVGNTGSSHNNSSNNIMSSWEGNAYYYTNTSGKSMSRASSFNSLQDGHGGYHCTIQSYLQPRSVAYFEVKIERNNRNTVSVPP